MGQTTSRAVFGMFRCTTDKSEPTSLWQFHNVESEKTVCALRGHAQAEIDFAARWTCISRAAFGMFAMDDSETASQRQFEGGEGVDPVRAPREHDKPSLAQVTPAASSFLQICSPARPSICS